MLSLLNTDFLLNLVIINGVLIVSFLLIHHKYYQISAKLETLTASSKHLDEKQRKILKHFFPFYNKLSPFLQRRFEQKLLYFYYTKRYETTKGLEIFDRMKLFISAYAAQVSLGFRSYGFSHIEKVVIYPEKFYSEKRKMNVRWELDDQKTLHLSWKDFFEQMRKEVMLPIGLQIMAHAIKKDQNERLKDQIFQTRTLLFRQIPATDPNALVRPMFEEDDFRTREDFLEACLKNYLSHPIELKNNFPDLFRKLDQLLYSQIKVS